MKTEPASAHVADPMKTTATAGLFMYYMPYAFILLPKLQICNMWQLKTEELTYNEQGVCLEKAPIRN
jgi:hypothetical protein